MLFQKIKTEIQNVYFMEFRKKKYFGENKGVLSVPE